MDSLYNLFLCFTLRLLLNFVPGLMSYTVLYSLLKYPAGVVPVTKVIGEDQEKLNSYVGHYNDKWDEQIREVREFLLQSTTFLISVQFINIKHHILSSICILM